MVLIKYYLLYLFASQYCFLFYFILFIYLFYLFILFYLFFFFLLNLFYSSNLFIIHLFFFPFLFLFFIYLFFFLVMIKNSVTECVYSKYFHLSFFCPACVKILLLLLRVLQERRVGGEEPYRIFIILS